MENMAVAFVLQISDVSNCIHKKKQKTSSSNTMIHCNISKAFEVVLLMWSPCLWTKFIFHFVQSQTDTLLVWQLCTTYLKKITLQWPQECSIELTHSHNQWRNCPIIVCDLVVGLLGSSHGSIWNLPIVQYLRQLAFALVSNTIMNIIECTHSPEKMSIQLMYTKLLATRQYACTVSFTPNAFPHLVWSTSDVGICSLVSFTSASQLVKNWMTSLLW